MADRSSAKVAIMDTLIRSLGSHGSDGKNSWIVTKVALVSLLVRAASILVLVILPLSCLVECFDCSSRLEYLPWMEGFVRWDTIHFIGITRREYLGRFHPTNGPVRGPARVEQDWAFGQGIIWIFRITRAFLGCPKSMNGSPNQVLPASVIVWSNARVVRFHSVCYPRQSPARLFTIT